MSTQVTNYKCPNCTGPLHFSALTGKLECDFCDGSFDVAEIEAISRAEEQKAEEAAIQAQIDGSDQAGDEWGEEFAGMKVYSCPSCGAEMFCDQTTAATFCPYCGNTTVLPGQLGGTMRRPDYIIPFKLDQKAAEQALRNHYKGKPLLPRAFRDPRHLQDIKGIYVPFWLFNGQADAAATFEATTSRSYRSGRYEVTVTKHYDCEREGRVGYARIPVDGSSKMPDEYMDSIEPYDYNGMVEFSTAYLPGFLADKYDVPVEDCKERAEKRATASALDALSETVTGYHTCTVKSYNVMLQPEVTNYALLPVWLLTTRWKDKDYIFAMNGQTGKLVGDLPASRGRFWAWFGGIFAGSTVLLTLLTALMNL